MDEQKIGVVTHYFTKIGVAAIKLEKPLSIGQNIHIKGVTTDFTQAIESMQVNHEDISEAKAGEEIGTKVKEQVREGDEVYLVNE